MTRRYTPDTDGAPAVEVLREVARCAWVWQAGARLLGNVRAEDIRRSIAWALAVITQKGDAFWTPLVTHHHYKGGSYREIGRGTHTETGERLVAYVDEGGRFHFRPEEMFDGKLPNGRERFEIVDKDRFAP